MIPFVKHMIFNDICIRNIYNGRTNGFVHATFSNREDVQ